MKLSILFLSLSLSAATLRGIEVRGIVISAVHGQALAKVTVYLAGTEYRTKTDRFGRFQLGNVPPGSYLLIATAVGFGFSKKEIDLTPEFSTEFEISLNPGTQIAQEVTVTADDVLSAPELTATEIHKLKSVLADDPIRALQQLPGLVASDDFNSGFALQGSGFDRVGILFDGVPVYAFLHTLDGVKDRASTTVLSADLIEGLDLVTGGTSAEWGAGSAGFLKLRSRTGNTSQWRNLVSVSGTAALVVSEGPVRGGSWIGSARKSYMDWIVRKIDPGSELNFGFYDFFGKVTQARGEKHLFSFSLHHGNTGLNNVVESIGLNSIYRGRFMSDLVHLDWTYLCNDRVTASTHLYWQRGDSLNRNKQGRIIWRNDQSVAGLRSVWNFRLRNGWIVSTGATAERWQGANLAESYDRPGQRWVSLSNFQTSTTRQELFVQTEVPIHPKLGLSTGLSWSRLAAVGESPSSPFLGMEFAPTKGQAFTFFVGRTHQFPFLTQLYGNAGNTLLVPETADTIQGGWSHRRSNGLELRILGYHRRRKDVPWRQKGLWRLAADKPTPPSSSPFGNVLRDRSSGAEIRVARRGVNGLSGWVGYAWGQSRWSEEDRIWFPGNFDLRHSISLFTHYRWSSQLDLSLKWKLASGLPIPAYVSRRNGQYFLVEERNLERLPDYSRLDARVAKSFNKDRYRLTLFVEVLNLMDRENLRFSGFGLDSVNRGTGRVRRLVEEQFPILPTAGLTVEF